MKFEIYADWQQLPDTVAVFDCATSESVFSSRAWFESVSNTVMVEGQSIVLACVISQGRVQAILPLVSNNGDTWYALRHRYSPHYHLLITDVERQAVIACLVKGLSQLPIRGLVLEPVIGGDDVMDELQQQLESAGFACERMFRHYNWIHHMGSQSSQEYMSSRPARLRNTIARKSRKLEREQGYEIRLYSGDNVPDAMADYCAVYQASWKAYEQYVGFVDSVVAGFSRAGWTRLGVLYINGRPAAAQLWFVHRAKASIFRLSYDEMWKPYSPGSILTAFLMEQVIDQDKVVEIDFLTGNEAYKQDWMSERRTCYALSCVKNVTTTDPFTRFVELLKRKLHRVK